MSLLKRVALSRVGHLLLVVHLCLVVYGFAWKPSVSPYTYPCVAQPSSNVLIAGRSYHFHYESDLIKALTALDLPAFTLGSFLDTLLSSFQICAYAASWIFAAIFLSLASLQWLVIGWFLEVSFRGLRSGR